MSRFLEHKNGKYEWSIENIEICKYRINEVCCNAQSEYVGDYPYPNCKCESKKDCKHFEKEY